MAYVVLGLFSETIEGVEGALLLIVNPWINFFCVIYCGWFFI